MGFIKVYSPPSSLCKVFLFTVPFFLFSVGGSTRLVWRTPVFWPSISGLRNPGGFLSKSIFFPTSNRLKQLDMSQPKKTSNPRKPRPIMCSLHGFFGILWAYFSEFLDCSFCLVFGAAARLRFAQQILSFSLDDPKILTLRWCEL